MRGNLVAGGGAAAGNSLLPGGDLHSPILLQILVHVEGLEQQVRLVAHALSQALVLRAVKVILQDGLVVGMCALVDDDSSPFAGRKATHVRETLDICQSILGHHNKKQISHTCSVTMTSKSCSV